MVSASKSQTKSLRAAAPLLTRLVALVVAFIVLSGIIGPRIISHGLINKDGFQIYGGAGKALLFGLLALALLLQRKGIVNLKLKPWRPIELLWAIAALVSAIVAWLAIGKLIAGNESFMWVIAAHVGIIASVALATLACFGLQNLRQIWHDYKRELLLALGLFVAFFVFLYAVYGLWGVLATIVLHCVKWLAELSGLNVTLLPPRTLLFDKFGINVAEYCSGIESIALFTGLYALIGVLDWKRLNHRKLFLTFPAALVILFALNILRVFALIMAGYYINPQIAFTLFHTYAGMLFFILYSIVFWAIAYKWMLATPPKTLKED